MSSPAPDAPGPSPLTPVSRDWTATDHHRPRSLNSERSGHWRAHREGTREERERWGWIWRATIPSGTRLERIRVVASPSYKRSPADTGNCYPSVKAALDGLVDVGIIPDDTGAHVLSITMTAPTSGPDSLSVTISEIPS